ncbi:MAG: hypothetical protein NC218_12070, partial [Acetobacter sp.]|nr:hypothetical protein [Acetobacter sp.]
DMVEDTSKGKHYYANWTCVGCKKKEEYFTLTLTSGTCGNYRFGLSASTSDGKWTESVTGGTISKITAGTTVTIEPIDNCSKLHPVSEFISINNGAQQILGSSGTTIIINADTNVRVSPNTQKCSTLATKGCVDMGGNTGGSGGTDTGNDNCSCESGYTACPSNQSPNEVITVQNNCTKCWKIADANKYVVSGCDICTFGRMGSSGCHNCGYTNMANEVLPYRPIASSSACYIREQTNAWRKYTK